MTVHNTIDAIKEMVLKTNSINESNKTKLLDLLETLKPEMVRLSVDQADQAKHVAEYIKRSTEEALRQQKDTALLKMHNDGLLESVRSFEVSHPLLVENVNYIATVLAKMGI